MNDFAPALIAGGACLVLSLGIASVFVIRRIRRGPLVNDASVIQLRPPSSRFDRWVSWACQLIASVICIYYSLAWGFSAFVSETSSKPLGFGFAICFFAVSALWLHSAVIGWSKLRK